MRTNTYAAAAASRERDVAGEGQSGQRREKRTLERIFVTPRPEGGFRDNLIIEVRQVNGAPFRGSLHFKEAKFGIFEQTLNK